MKLVRALFAASLVTMIAMSAAPPVEAAEGQMTWGLHVSLLPTWFDPAETSSTITHFISLYALHDAMVRPSVGQAMAPSLAESWTVSPDGLLFDFVLRKGVRFHNGEPVTNGLGRRVEESGIGLIPGYIFSAPYEDVKLKGQ